MTLQVEVPPELEAELAVRARAEGVPADVYVRRVLEREIQAQRPAAPMTPQERAQAFLEWAKNFPPTPPLSDEAISRESLYQRDEV